MYGAWVGKDKMVVQHHLSTTSTSLLEFPDVDDSSGWKWEVDGEGGGRIFVAGFVRNGET